ncbi:MAG: flagellar biosynthetic protein FliR [Candidatus Margulisbacteria bacterium]|nr:flagellar biosynthetic protein FliR [Candidatus Margulisiibacteriota bacterium]MBU1021185.1 flagellar biosynthetic protein FliR [Candidatus Margulisiibacteriota bacterium]MBU1729791.1 flagellar biosynthetic protein FliR [Candidatus Margulisiibacteriota bacterium]MBU1955292.1 flagellar biosynthetic protein FliR [Candidatus Margulisiibacteriota bacterium]
MIITLGQIVAAFLIFARIAGIFIQAPVLSSRSIPSQAKTAMAVWIAVALWFVVPLSKTLPVTVPMFILAVVAEVALGYLIGLVCNILFVAVQAAGEIMDLQMGLSVATALDPVFGSVISIIGKLTFYLALVIFLAVNGHHLLLSGLHNSFTVIPAGSPINIFNGAVTVQLLALGGQMWIIAIQLAAPIVLMIFLSDFTFGIVSRVAPQVNVFMLGFQVKPSLGIFALMTSAPLFVKYVSGLVEKMGEEIVKLLAALK